MPTKAKKHTRRPPRTTPPAHRKGPSQKAINVKPAHKSREPAVRPATSSFSVSVPKSYGTTFMCAAPRDPGSIFVYWEIAPDAMDGLRKTAGDDLFNSSKWVLRVIDVTDILFDGTNAWQTIDIFIHRDEKKKYVQAPEPGRTYLLECGILTPDNSFFEAVRSNRCDVPRKGVSDRLDEGWNMVGTTELIRISTDALGSGAVAAQRLNGLGIALGEGSGSGSIM